MPRFALILALSACTANTVAPPEPTTTPTPSTSPQTRRAPVFDSARMLDVVEELAALGPREATSKAYVRGAAVVERELRAMGYVTRRQAFDVPAGVSWGVRVRAGRSFNVIAEHPRARYVVGAHLDTVPQSPGANDNASGIAVMLELARMAAFYDTPITFIAFGAEEPRGDGDDRHHYGSRHYVAREDAPRGMLSLDRVGIGSRVRICSGARASRQFRARFLTSARALRIAQVVACTDRNSDHWSFERAGIPGVRLLGEPHATYHTARDLPGVVSRAQMLRMARIAWETLG